MMMIIIIFIIKPAGGEVLSSFEIPSRLGPSPVAR